MDVLGLAIFGHDFKTLEGAASDAISAYNFAFNNLLLSAFHVFLPFLDYVPSPAVNKMVSSLNIIDNLIYALIEKSKNRPTKEITNLLDMMVDSNANETDEALKMTNLELRNNVAVFFVAGHETTSNSLSFGLYCLAKYPEVQEKLYAEIMEKVGKDGEITFKKVQEMEYLFAVIRETMRYYPPIVVTPTRESQKEEILGDYKVPAKVCFKQKKNTTNFFL